MNNFWSLVGFESKKILQNKAAICSIVLAWILVVFSCFAMVLGGNRQSDYRSESMSNYEAMQLDKQLEKQLEGRPLDGALIWEASNAYKKIDADSTNYTQSEGYRTYAKQYHSVYTLIDAAFAQPGKAFDIKDFQNISEETADNYYALREAQYRTNLTNNTLWSPSAIEKVISLDAEVQKPFVMAYTDGYQRFFALSMTTMAISLLVISFCLSPIFSNEYAKKTDALILTAKNGKGSLIGAKIVTSLLFSFGLILFFFLSNYFSCMSIYGFDGTMAQLQLLLPAITYDFTLLDTVLLLAVTSLFGALLHTGLCLFLSSLSGNAIVPMAVTSLFIAVGMFGGIDQNFFIKLRYFFPSAMGNFSDVLTQFVFELFGVQLLLYQAVCIVAAVAGGLLLFCSYRSFQRHQVR